MQAPLMRHTAQRVGMNVSKSSQRHTQQQDVMPTICPLHQPLLLPATKLSGLVGTCDSQHIASTQCASKFLETVSRHNHLRRSPSGGVPLLSWHHEECLTEPYLRSNHSVAAAPMPAACHWNHWAPGAEWFQGESEQQCRWNVSACFMYRELTSVMQIGFCPTVVSTTASNLLLHPSDSE